MEGRKRQHTLRACCLCGCTPEIVVHFRNQTQHSLAATNLVVDDDHKILALDPDSALALDPWRFGDPSSHDMTSHLLFPAYFLLGYQPSLEEAEVQRRLLFFSFRAHRTENRQGRQPTQSTGQVTHSAHQEKA